MTGVADPITPAGASQRVVDTYAEQFANEKLAAFAAYKTTKNYVAPVNKLLMLWNTTPSKGYTTFNDAGSPITTTPAATGTNHCNFSTAQLLVVAKSLVSAGATGKVPSGGGIVSAGRKAGNLVIDPEFRAPWLKYYNQ
jgi:hypothetical protein